MALFFIVFFSVYSAVNYYIFIRGWQALQSTPTLRIFYLIAFLIAALSYLLSRIFEKSIPIVLYEVMTWVGSFWFAYILYVLLFVVFFDLIRLGNYFFNYYPAFIKTDYAAVKLISFWGVFIISSLIILGGYINTRILNVTEISLSAPKKSAGIDNLKIAMISDIHLSTINDDKFLAKIVGTINDLNPDILLIPGDLVDDKAHYLKRRGIGNAFSGIKAPYGIYASMGNHEFINGGASSEKYIESLGIKMLRDEYIMLDGNIIIAARDDSSKSSFTNEKRLPLKDVLNGIGNEYPVILMDHTPFKLEEAAYHQVALQLSGHTHHGQLYPLNFITSMIYEVSRGYKQKENTHYYVSSGVGTWGPPVRTGSLTEIVLINLNLE